MINGISFSTCELRSRNDWLSHLVDKLHLIGQWSVNQIRELLSLYLVNSISCFQARLPALKEDLVVSHACMLGSNPHQFETSKSEVQRLVD